MYRIMLVDDEEKILNALRRVITNQRAWELETYSSANDALKRAYTCNFDLFLSDHRMPEMSGVQFLTETKQCQPEAMRIILSGYAEMEGLMGAINQAEIFRFISKPWHDYDLISTLENALAHRDALVENRRLADQVRQQSQELDKRRHAIEELRRKHPALVEVNWGPDGAIILGDLESYSADI